MIVDDQSVRRRLVLGLPVPIRVLPRVAARRRSVALLRVAAGRSVARLGAQDLVSKDPDAKDPIVGPPVDETRRSLFLRRNQSFPVLYTDLGPLVVKGTEGLVSPGALGVANGKKGEGSVALLSPLAAISRPSA